MPSFEEIQEIHLEQAIADGSVKLVYQPRIAAKSSKTVGLECVLRWGTGNDCKTDPAMNADWSSAEFARLWEWKLSQLETVFAYLQRLQKRSGLLSPKFFVSLSLSPRLLHSDNWAVQLLQTIEKSRIPGECIEVALLERGEALNTSFVEWSFEAVRTAGVMLTLATFPGGSLSFSQVAQYKFDRVKIDKLMIPTLQDPVAIWSKKRELLRGLIVMLKNIGAEVVMGGIDKEVHFNFLQDLPVLEWQGAYWGEAVELEQLLPLLSSFSKQNTNNAQAADNT